MGEFYIKFKKNLYFTFTICLIVYLSKLLHLSKLRFPVWRKRIIMTPPYRAFLRMKRNNTGTPATPWVSDQEGSRRWDRLHLPSPPTSPPNMPASVPQKSPDTQFIIGCVPRATRKPCLGKLKAAQIPARL